MNRNILLPLICMFSLLSCKSKKQDESATDVSTKQVQTDQASTTSNSVIGLWKIVEWNTSDELMSAADKQHVMDVSTIEITTDGKFINHSPGNPDAVSTYVYYENTRTISLTNPSGQKQSNKISFNGDRMTIVDAKGSMVLQRKS